MRILVAPDSFKGSLTAVEAASAMARGFRAVFPEAEILEIPVADGGEGTVAALVGATGGSLHAACVRGPLDEPVEAAWGALGDGRTAAVEVASASGLTLVPEGRRDVARSSTFGTGELIAEALDAGFRRLVIGLGGSATVDGGSGMLRALGARFLDAQGRDLPPGGLALAQLAEIDVADLDPRLAGTEVLVACDVDNPLCGPRGAAAVFGPQKGASPELVPSLDLALARFAEVVARVTGRTVAEVPGAGAAGGLGAALAGFTAAAFRPGVQLLLEAMAFDARLDGVDLVVTGEGRTDAQTAMGKAPAGVATAARRRQVPVLCLSGGLDGDGPHFQSLGFDAVAALPPGPMSLGACLSGAAPLLEAAASRAAALLRLGARLGAGGPRAEGSPGTGLRH